MSNQQQVTHEVLAFGELLRRLRLQAGLTQAALAERAGLSERGIADLERGTRRFPHADTVTRLATGLDLSETDAAALKYTTRRPPNERTDNAWRQDSTHGNIPLQRMSLIGREYELEALCEWLTQPDRRLVTITGPGGSGKTQLALIAAASVQATFSDGTWLVNLANVPEPVRVASAVAETLGIREEPATAPVDGLRAAVNSRAILLVLDNCEHVALACAELASSLLDNCPNLRILATSRVPLHISGEYVWPLGTLSVPPEQDRANAARCSTYAAVRLFVDRARAIAPDFNLTDTNSRVVAEICAALDGLPLAIELAAAWIRVLAPAELLQRLEHVLDLPVGGDRTANTRHGSLRAAFDWSFSLLGEFERTVFARTSVFRGGWSLEAAEVVCSEPLESSELILPALAALVDRSLVLKGTASSATSRYWVLEPVRHYATEQLAMNSDAHAIRARHAEYYALFAERIDPLLIGSEQVAWLDQLDADAHNLRAALSWFAETNSTMMGARLASALMWWWIARGHRNEGAQWVRRFLSDQPSTTTPWRMKALYAAGLLEWLRGYHMSARACFDKCLTLAREQGDHLFIGRALDGLGRVDLALGNAATAATHHLASLQLQREQSDHHGAAYSLLFLGQAALAADNLAQAEERYSGSLAEFSSVGDLFGQANALRALGDVARRSGRLLGARVLEEESIECARAIGNRDGIALALDILGAIALEEDDHARAHACFSQSLRLRRDLGMRAQMADSMALFARLARARGDMARAARLLDAATGLRNSVGPAGNTPTSPIPGDLEHRELSQNDSSFGPQMEAPASEDEAVAYALESSDFVVRGN